MPLRIGTRASALAQWQANWVAAELIRHGQAVELVLITTQGDATQGTATAGGTPIGKLKTVGVFTKELQQALLDGRIDLAVHSLKDLPTDTIAGLKLAAVPPRELVEDALLSREGVPFEKLPQKAVIGTGSLRRRAQLLNARPDLQMADIRGNVDTRLRKLAEGQFDAIILAQAGLRRLELSDRISQILPLCLMLPAVGQGALGIEARSDDGGTLAALSALNDPATHVAVTAERSLLAALSGGCLAPVGAYAQTVLSGELYLRATVLSPDGAQRLDAEASAPVADSQTLGEQVARKLLDAGAARLIEQSRV